MSRQPRIDPVGYHRANRAGVMLILITLCQYGIPAVFYWVLTALGTDTSADQWGMTSPAFLTVYLLMYVLMMGLPLLICRRFLLPKQRHLSPLNLSLDRKLCVVLCAVGLCLLANIAAAFFSGALYRAGVRESELLSLGDGSIPTLLMELIVFAVVPAVMEETLLRGMVLQTLRPLGDGAAVITSAVLFGLMHGNLSQAPFALLMGLILGAVFVHTDDLRLTVVIHTLSNALALITGYLLQFFDTDFATFWELLILVVVLMMGGIAALWLYRHPLERSPQTYHASPYARRRALTHAPLLWLAVLIMALLMIFAG